MDPLQGIDLKSVPFRTSYQSVPAICRTKLQTAFQNDWALSSSQDPTGTRTGFCKRLLPFDPRNPRDDGSANERPQDWDYWQLFYSQFYVLSCTVKQMFTSEAIDRASRHGLYMYHGFGPNEDAGDHQARLAGWDNLWKQAQTQPKMWRPHVKTYTPSGMVIGSTGASPPSNNVVEVSQPHARVITTKFDVHKFFTDYPFGSSVDVTQLIENSGWTSTATDASSLIPKPVIAPYFFYGIADKTSEDAGGFGSCFVETWMEWDILFAAPNPYVLSGII